MSKAKGFTLIELIVAMAVFSILMLGVMQIAGPMSEAAATNEVVNNQKMVENSIITYLGERLRYATNILIIEGNGSLSPNDAIAEFIKTNPVDSYGNSVFPNPSNPNDSANNTAKLKVKLICFDRAPDPTDIYSYQNHNYSGRLISTIDDRASDTMNFSNIKQDGNSNLYEVFGNDYYNHADYYLTAQIKNNQLYLKVDSDYYYSNAHNRFNDSSTNPVEGVFEFRTVNRSSASRVCMSIKHGTTDKEYIASAARGTSVYNRIYFVYLYPDSYTD